MIDKFEQIEKHFGQMAALIGERNRAVMLWNLLDGKAYTATELAVSANISPQAASNHLSKMVKGGLLMVAKQGRHQYYRFANENVARVIENIAGLVPIDVPTTDKKIAVEHDIKYARTCYDHLAGKLGVQVTQSLVSHQFLIPKKETYSVSEKGVLWFAELDIDVDIIQKEKRKFAFPCLDWSERNYHLAGGLGAALLSSFIERDWVRKKRNSRQVVLTSKGIQGFRDRLHLPL